MAVLDLFKLDGKVALVTGGAGRFGRQMTRALAEAGAVVYTASRRLEPNEEYAAELRKEGLDVRAESYDQSDEESIKALLARMVDACGKVDILVNNSVLRPMKDYHDSPDVFLESLKVNGSGLFAITRVFGDHMAENKYGSIINIGSYMGILGCDETLYEETPWMNGFGAPDYFYHKGGMNNLTRFIAAYYGKYGVRCNYLALGGLFANQDSRFLERYAKRTFIGRMANEQDVQGIVVYLASDASLYTTGTSIPIDGGYSAK